MTIDVATQLFPPSALAANRLRVATLPRPQPRARRTVLDVSEFFGETSGGIRTYLTEKARFVERSLDMRQALVVPGPWSCVTESERVRCYRLRSLPVPGQAPYRFLLGMRTSRRILANERPDIVEVGSPGFAPWHVLAESRRLGIPVVAFFHTHVARLMAGNAPYPGMARRVAASLAWKYLRRLDQGYACTMVASHYAAAELAHAGIEHTAYVSLGVDLQRFHPAHRLVNHRVREQLGARDRPLVVFLGRVASEKRIDVILRAWPRVARRTGAVLAIVGDGPLRRELQARHPHRDVHWLGFLQHRSELASLLASADALVSPGEVETFGLAALEALASGTPVLSADDGGGAELVRESRAGLLFESGWPESLAWQLETLLAQDRSQLGARGRAHAVQHHSWDRVFGSVFALYERVIGAA